MKKKKLVVLFFLLFITLCICFYSTYAKNVSSTFIYENNVFCVTPIYEFSNISCKLLQEKINKVYSSKEKVVYLTFDDGPTKVATKKVLDILKEEDVKATFFVIGYRVEEFPELVKRAYDEGHLICNHTYSHKINNLYQSKTTFLNEIDKAEKAIQTAIKNPNYCTHLFRFPNGSNSYSYSKNKCKDYLNEYGYAYVDWNALNQDSLKKYNSYELLTNLKKSCKNKDSLVILMHDTADVSRSYLALKDSIKYLKEQGYTFKTFADLLS